MRLMYIAGPYWAETEEAVKYNIKQAENLGIQLVQEYNDWYPVIPHMNTALWDFKNELEQIEDNFYLTGTMEMMKRCDGVLVVPNYEHSWGTRQELLLAINLGIPIYYNLTEI